MEALIVYNLTVGVTDRFRKLYRRKAGVRSTCSHPRISLSQAPRDFKARSARPGAPRALPPYLSGDLGTEDAASLPRPNPNSSNTSRLYADLLPTMVGRRSGSVREDIVVNRCEPNALPTAPHDPTVFSRRCGLPVISDFLSTDDRITTTRVTLDPQFDSTRLREKGTIEDLPRNLITHSRVFGDLHKYGDRSDTELWDKR
ncbi:hypothetical protein Bbelb_158600 [Branchiostoma belcheri]|nr:hypothetical protein Bbelb_158600 [Branchiostoma belcheri]